MGITQGSGHTQCDPNPRQVSRHRPRLSYNQHLADFIESRSHDPDEVDSPSYCAPTAVLAVPSGCVLSRRLRASLQDVHNASAEVEHHDRHGSRSVYRVVQVSTLAVCGVDDVVCYRDPAALLDYGMQRVFEWPHIGRICGVRPGKARAGCRPAPSLRRNMNWNSAPSLIAGLFA